MFSGLKRINKAVYTIKFFVRPGFLQLIRGDFFDNGFHREFSDECGR